jgi:subtilisin family serine protease
MGTGERKGVMKRSFLAGLLLLGGIASLPAQAASGRLIVRVLGGLPVAQAACLLAGCTVAENIDGAANQLFLVTTPNVLNLNGILTTLSRIVGVVDVEIDQVAKVSDNGTNIPAALADNTPVTYFGTTVPHGYVSQPATARIRLADAQAAYPNVTGSGVVAVIDTGVDTHHPALQNVLLPGYDFTRNRSGADETLDVTLANPPVVSGVLPAWVSGNGSGDVSQSTAAVVDQSTAAVVDGNPQYSDFGHGTMVAGLIHLVAPTARILPLKAFRADGTGYTSDILRAIYWAMLTHANVYNMSFSLPSYSQELATALGVATLTGTISIASAGNSGARTLVYPAALSNVVGVASTTDNDQLSTFSNYGPQLVWVAAPGEAVVTTYPFGTYAAGWGTSFSTPMVAGLAALLVNVNPLCDQYSDAQSTAQAQPISSDAGNGRLDVFRAVDYWHRAVNP